MSGGPILGVSHGLGESSWLDCVVGPASFVHDILVNRTPMGSVNAVIMGLSCNLVPKFLVEWNEYFQNFLAVGRVLERGDPVTVRNALLGALRMGAAAVATLRRQFAILFAVISSVTHGNIGTAGKFMRKIVFVKKLYYWLCR